jgi:hypothetical protein
MSRFLWIGTYVLVISLLLSINGCLSDGNNDAKLGKLIKEYEDI